MNAQQHYREAIRFASLADKIGYGTDQTRDLLAAAQVHADLFAALVLDEKD